jgi:hypothetical protein
MSLLPDFAEEKPAPPVYSAPGFEPLVHAASSKEEFSSLDMPIGFMGLEPATDTETEIDPFAAAPLADDGEIGDLDIGSLEDLDLPGLDDIPAAGAAGPSVPDLPQHPAGDLPAETGLDDIDQAAADGVAAQAALEEAHREEIERLQFAHREALDLLLKESLPKAKQEIVETLASELAPLLAGRLREGLVEQSVAALSDMVARLLDDTAALTFDLHGPEHLVLAFQNAWEGDAAQINPMPDESVDLVARIDKTVIATRLAEADRLIAEALT